MPSQSAKPTFSTYPTHQKSKQAKTYLPVVKNFIRASSITKTFVVCLVLTSLVLILNGLILLSLACAVIIAFIYWYHCSTYYSLTDDRIIFSTWGIRNSIWYADIEYLRVVMVRGIPFFWKPGYSTPKTILVIGKKSLEHNSAYYVQTYGNDTRYTLVSQTFKRILSANEIGLNIDRYQIGAELLIHRINTKRFPNSPQELIPKSRSLSHLMLPSHQTNSHPFTTIFVEPKDRSSDTYTPTRYRTKDPVQYVRD